MKSASIKSKPLLAHSVRAVIMSIAMAALAVCSASAKVGTQMSDFFYPDGSLVVSDNGEPADAVLNRFYDTQHNGINWQLMTQHLTPGETYDIWLEGSNDGTAAGAFSWWLASTTANPQGEINAFANVYVGKPPGAYTGWFSNSRAQVHLVIKTTDGETIQTAFFPAF
jgi:hypothetical protein